MTAQLDLFPARSRRSDPLTSRDAAQTVGSTITALVFSTFAGSFNGFSDDELCAHLTDDARRWPPIKSARSRLAGQGWLHDSGIRRPSTRCRMQIVWEYGTAPMRQIATVKTDVL